MVGPVQELGVGALVDDSFSALSGRVKSPYKRKSRVDEIDDNIKQQIIGETVAKTMQHLMSQGRLVMEDETRRPQQKFNKGRSEPEPSVHSRSEVTIYDKAICRAEMPASGDPRVLNLGEPPVHRLSGGSDEGPDTSDEAIMIAANLAQVNVGDADDQEVAGQPIINDEEYDPNNQINVDFVPGAIRANTNQPVRRALIAPGPEPSTSDGRTGKKAPFVPPEKIAMDLIRESELSKEPIYNIPGRQVVIDASNIYVHSAMVDENYLLVRAHLDEAIKHKIVASEYVDFAKLLPKDRVLEEEDSRMQMVYKNGQTYFVPAQETVAIQNYSRWEQAFRAFSDVYTRAQPQKVI